MANLFDYIVLGAAAYYGVSKSKENDPDFNRALGALVAGGLTYLKGPEVYDSLKERVTESTPEQNDKALGTLIGALGGYYTGDKIGSRIRKEDS